MTDDPRLTAFLALAQERRHPFYAYGAWVLASRYGDLAAVAQALELGAANYVPEPPIRMRAEKVQSVSTQVIQLQLFEEIAA